MEQNKREINGLKLKKKILPKDIFNAIKTSIGKNIYLYEIDIHTKVDWSKTWKEEQSTLEDDAFNDTYLEDVAASVRNIEKILKGKDKIINRKPYYILYVTAIPVKKVIRTYEPIVATTNLQITELKSSYDKLPEYGICKRFKEKEEVNDFIEELVEIFSGKIKLKYPNKTFEVSF